MLPWAATLSDLGSEGGSGLPGAGRENFKASLNVGRLIEIGVLF